MFAFSPVYWGVLLSVIIFGHMAETHSTTVVRSDGSLWNKPNKTAAVILSLILILVSGFRYYVGTDFPVYYSWFISSWSQAFFNLVHFREGGFSLLAKVANMGGFNGQNLIFLSAVITIGLYCRTIYKHSSIYFIAMLLYLFMGEWQGSFNAIRQYLAAAILFAGHRLILQQNLPKYVTVVLLASMFHKTAIVMLMPYFLLTKKPNHSQLVLLAFGAIVIRFSYGFLFNAVGELKGTEINVASDPYLYNDVNPLRILVTFVPVAIYFLMCPKDNLTKEQILYVNACLFNAFSMLAAAGSCYLARIGSYTSAMAIVGYTYLFQMIEKKDNRQTTTYLVIIMYFLYWLYSLRIVSGGRFMFNFNIGF